MAKLTRRRFLEGTAAAGLTAPVFVGCGDDGDGGSCSQLGPNDIGSCAPMASAPSPLFQHAVASGDPFADSVILWTRVTPQDGEASFDVDWEIATDPCFDDVVASGAFTTDAERDFTVKVEATGLSAGTTYYYRFATAGAASPIGRTRTLPTGCLERLKLAFVSCSNYPAGLFHAYRGIAQRDDLDVVLHLGDYTYEYANAEYGDGGPLGRTSSPDAETVTLAQYRQRLAQYRTDPDLQEAHRQNPWIVVWDDHETTNNAWTGGAENHTPGEEGDWATRVQEALQAYFEWLPIREPASGDRREIYRGFEFGDLVDLMMLESRLVGREEQATTVEAAGAEGRQLLGAAQEAWLLDRLSSSRAIWKVLGQQTIFTHFVTPNFATTFLDQWQGYVDARQRILDAVDANGESNMLVLTGDIHSSWAAEIPVDPTTDRNRSVGAEFVSPSVTSQSFGPAAAEVVGIPEEQIVALLESEVYANNAHVKWADLFEHGYVLLDVTRDRAQADWYFVGDIRSESFSETFSKGWSVQRGTGTLEEEAEPVASRPGPVLAP